MDSAESAAAKFSSLYAELAAKSSRVAELEARVSALETENAGLRETLARREATGSTGEEDPMFRRLATVFRGTKHEAAAKAGESVARDAIEVSDDEEEEGGVAVDAHSKGRSLEEGVIAVPAPRKRVVAWEKEGEADAEDAEAGGGGGSNGESSAGLEDDDVTVTPRGKKRGAAAARVVTSDSEGEGVDGGDEGELGSGWDVGHGQAGLTRSRKRAFRRVSDSEDEDGNAGIGAALHQTGSGEEDEYNMVPIYELLKRVPMERMSEDGDVSDEAKGHSAPATRRSARLAKNRSKSNRVSRGASDSEDEDSDSDDEDDNEGIAAPQTDSKKEEKGDDMVPIYKLLTRMPEKGASEDGNESDAPKEHSAPMSRRSARLAKNQSKSYRVFRGISDGEDEDGNEGISAPQAESGKEEEEDMIPIYKLFPRIPKEGAGEDGEEFDAAKRHSAPATRHSARLFKNQPKRRRAACRVLDFVEPKDVEGSEDDMEEDDDMSEFINDGSSDNASDSAEESSDESDVPSVLNEKSSPVLEVSDGEVDYKDVMACIGRKKKAKEWDYEADMLAAFGEHPDLCLKAVCALYRKQTEDEQLEKAALVHNKQGFSHKDAPRGSRIAEFLLDGNLGGPPRKTISDLDEYDRYAFEFCRKVASHYSKQLFAIYQNKEDPYFHP